MARYRNGLIPEGALVWFEAINEFGNLERFRATPATRDRILGVMADAKTTYGFTLYITSGPNVYRDWDQQGDMVRKYGVGRAAARGHSSHGGVWEGRDTMAVDFGNAQSFINKYSHAEFSRLMKRHGLTPFLISTARGYARTENWHVIDLNPWSTPSAASNSTPISSSKDIRVKTYHKEDKTARRSGRTVKPGQHFYLHEKTGMPTSNATNVVGGVGEYSITTHVYADGTPGDVLELVLLWDDTKSKGANSAHYVERITIDKDGHARASREFKRAVDLGYAVYLRCVAPKSNKSDVKVTVLDVDAYLFIGA